MQITNVLEYLENTVKRVPDKTAYANENMEMTFGEVYHDSRAIGSYLANNNYYKEPVVVFMKKHPHAITAFYGCVYGGCYYVPYKIGKLQIQGFSEPTTPKNKITELSHYAEGRPVKTTGGLFAWKARKEAEIF